MGADEPDDGADAGVERGHAVGHLRLRDDHERARIAVETAIADVADDADDLAGGSANCGPMPLPMIICWPTGFSFGQYFFAIASLIRTTAEQRRRRCQ